MKKFIHLVTGVLALVLNFCFAAEPTSELSAKDAVKLIALRSNLQESTVEIPFIVEGQSKSECFDVEHVRRVAAIHGVLDGNKQRRKLVFYDFFWNDVLGWFMWESRSERTGEAVYLWTEYRGEIVNR